MDAQKVKDVIQAIIDGLTPLAQKLQVPIEHLWGWGIKHNYGLAVAQIVGWVFTLVVASGVYRLLKYGNGKEKGSDYSRFYHSEALLFVTAGLTIATIIAVIVMTIMVLSDAVPRMVAPEWYTAQDISNLIRGK